MTSPPSPRSGKEAPFCWRCKEDFQVAGPNDRMRMGLLFPVAHYGARFFRSHPLEGITPTMIKAGETDLGQKLYLCGNCYFDVTEE
jgi:hypothetical protein